MRLPKQLMILGRKIKVEVCDMPEGEWGEYCSDAQVIHVSNQCPEATVEATLLHECIHAVLDVSGEEEIMTDGQQEKMARLFEHALAPLIKFKTSR